MLSEMDKEIKWQSLYRVGGISALLQLISILMALVISFVVGTTPTSPQEYFDIYAANKLSGILRSDFFNLFLIGMYLGTFPALFMALRRVNATYSLLASLFTLAAVTTCFATHAGFSMMYLSEQYAAAVNESQRLQLLAAGQAVMASDMWHSSGGYMAGLLLQGGGVIISLVMRGSKNFSRITVYSGLMGNAFDLLQHLLHPFLPGVSAVIIMFMGPFYLVWFPMLARDLLRLSRKNERE